MTTFPVEFDRDAYRALLAAIVGGALAARSQQLTELLHNNRSYSSIANSIEKEIEDLHRAGRCIAAAQPRTRS